jgi:hypothetical protein
MASVKKGKEDAYAACNQGSLVKAHDEHNHIGRFGRIDDADGEFGFREWRRQ